RAPARREPVTAAPLEIVTRIRSPERSEQGYLKYAGSVLGGILSWRLLSSLELLAPSSAAGLFPAVVGGTVSAVGLSGHAGKMARMAPAIDFDLSGMTNEKKIRTVQEIFSQKRTIVHYGVNPGEIRTVPLDEVGEIRSVEMKRVGTLGFRHPFSPLAGSLGGAVIASGLSYWLGASTISGCTGEECWDLKRRLVAINGSLGAAMGYLGARTKQETVVYELYDYSPPDKMSRIAHIMRNENGTASTNDEPFDVVHLKDNSYVKGTITLDSPTGHVTIETPDGNTFVFPRMDIQEVRRVTERQDVQAIKRELLLELQLSSIQSRQNFDLIVFLGSYVGTIAGYHLMGGDDLARIVVPVIGPFSLLDERQAQAPHTPFPFRQLLLAGSGAVQTGVLVDYLFSRKKERELKRRYDLGLYPSRNGLTLRGSLTF
ncbi:MAG: hypothetical protein ACE5HZ_09705, partial [Fidelibacterota bacterium]